MSAFARLGAGTIFGGDFRLVRPLGEGGMGAVWIAEQLSTGKERALKMMHAQLVEDDKMRARFVQEARIGARIESDHVVEVVAAGVDATTSMPWIAMELLKGETLQQRIDRAPIDLPTAREIFAQLCHALGAAHSAGIVHRDLKPENIFLGVSRRIGVPFTLKVLDFGIAKLVAESHTRAATGSLGTPLWMAPEQTEVGKPIRPSSDVWALGLVGFDVLTGKMYWHSANVPGSGPMQLLREVIMDPIEPASARARAFGVGERVPPGFDAWFARCLSRDAEARYANATEAHAALENMVFSSLGPARTSFSSVSSTDGALASPPRASGVSSGARTTAGASIDRDGNDDVDELEPAPVKSVAPMAAWVVGGLVVVGALFAVLVLYRGASDPPPPPVVAGGGHHVDEPVQTARPVDDPFVPAVTLTPLEDLSHLPDANQVLERSRDAMLGCYKQALVDAPNLSGTVTLTLKIDTAGRVSSADPSTSLADARVADCLQQVFQSMEFHAPIGGATTLSVPVVLSQVPQSLANLPIAPTSAPSAKASTSAGASSNAKKK